MSDYTHSINGKSATSPTKLDVIDPGTQQKIAEVPIATKQQLDEAVAAARAAFPGWSATPVDQRAAIVNKIADVIEANIEDYKKLITLEQGKTMNSSLWELNFSVTWMRGTSQLRLPNTVLVDNEHQRVTQRYVPVGVCGCLNPWNIPMISVAIKLSTALMTGNTIILKPSPFTPLTTLRFARDIQHLVPPGVVNVLSGDNTLGPMITSHPGIDKACGNDPMILLPDIDPKVVAPQIFWGTFLNSGQGCIAAKRLYIHEDIYDEFRDALVEYGKTVKVGNGMDPESQLGPIQNLPQYQKVLSYFEDAHANGYKFVLGGETDPNPVNGLYVPISIIDNPPEHSKIVREEPFGPIVPLLKWRDEKDVIKRANDTNLGLAASVWGKDIAVVERIAMQIQAGTVAMNQFIPFMPISPFSGHKQSGMGTEGGIEGLKAYSNVQTITLNKAPTLTTGA